MQVQITSKTLNLAKHSYCIYKSMTYRQVPTIMKFVTSNIILTANLSKKFRKMSLIKSHKLQIKVAKLDSQSSNCSSNCFFFVKQTVDNFPTYAVCGKYANLISPIFGKNFVKVTFKKLLKSWFDEIFLVVNSKFFIFPH